MANSSEFHVAGKEAVFMLKQLLEESARISTTKVKVFDPVSSPDGTWMLSFDIRIDAENTIEFSAVQTGFGGARFEKQEIIGD